MVLRSNSRRDRGVQWLERSNIYENETRVIDTLGRGNFCVGWPAERRDGASATR